MRKTIFTLGLMLAAALSLTNCTKNEEATFTPEVKVPFELYANMDDTRTTNNGLSTKWEANDEINVFHAVADSEDYVNDTPYVDGAGTPFVTDGTGKFKGTLVEELEAGTSYDWYVCYPYNSYMTSPNNTTGGRFYIGCRSDQAQTQAGNNSMAHIEGTNYPLYGVAKGVAASETPSITMSHASSLVEFNVTNTLDEAITVNSIVFTVDGNDEKIVGYFYMAIHEGKPTFTDYTYTSNVATLNVANGEAIAADASAKFYMGIKPFVADDYALTVAINATSASGKGTCTKELSEVSTTFAPGKIKTLNVGFDAVMEEVTEPESNLISTIDNLTAGQYYMAAYLVSYSNYNWEATPYHLWNGEVTSGSNGDLVTVDYSFNDNVLETSSSDSAAVVTLEAVAGKANTYYVKCGGKYLYSTQSATNRKLALSTDPVEWVATDNAKGGITLSSNSVYLGTAGAGSNHLRSYKSEGTLNTGVYFFAVEGGGDVEPTPSITAENISGVAAEGVTDATATFTSENLTEAITVTCDGTVVTAASVAESTITYYVSENTTDAIREGWIKLAANGVEKTIIVSQLAPISGETATGTINFKSTAHRVSQDGNSQVWKNDNITFTNNRAESQNDVVGNTNPVRLYASSSITITAPGKITQIEFVCDNSSYSSSATNLKNSVGSAATASGTNVTVSLDGTSDTFTVARLTAQVRLHSLTVTYIVSGDVVVKESQNLTFNLTEIEATVGEDVTEPTLSGAMTTVTYSSSNVAVATVDENTGAVTLVGAGTTTIKATAVETDEYYGAEASYTLTVNNPSSGDGDTATTGTVLWSEDFGSYGVNNTTFANNKTIAGYDYSGREGFGDNATSVTLTADASDNVRCTISSGTNCTSGHLWFNKNAEGTLTTSAIKLYGATSLSFSHSQGTGGSSCTSAYSTDGGSTWISLGTQSGAIATKEYTFEVPVGTESIQIRLSHPSSNEKNTRVDNLVLSVK